MVDRSETSPRAASIGLIAGLLVFLSLLPLYVIALASEGHGLPGPHVHLFWRVGFYAFALIAAAAGIAGFILRRRSVPALACIALSAVCLVAWFLVPT